MPFSDSFRAVRWVRTLNLVLQAVLFLTFFAGLNYLVRNYPLRFDLTQYRRFSLSPETTSYLKNLNRDVRIVATVSDDEDLPLEVSGLLDEYVHATETNLRNRITTEVVNVYKNRRRAEELGLEVANVLLLVCGENRRAVPVTDLYRVRRTEEGETIREAFLGEQRLTAAVLEVSSPERQRIYFLVGHGELQPDDTTPGRGLSVLRDELKVRNFSVDTLDLSVNRRVPEDAALLVAVWPQTAYSKLEQELLRQYMSVNAGRLILLLGPGASVARLGLDDLLLDWGVLVFDDVLYERDPEYQTSDGELIVKTLSEVHPITQPLHAAGLALRLGYARTVAPDPTRVAGGGLVVTPVAATSPTAWGDVGYRIGLQPDFSTPGNTHPIPGLVPKGQLGVVVASERVTARTNLAFSVRAGRMVVFGSGDFVANQRIGSGGNGAAFLNAVNWAVERDRQLNVPARPIERFQLAISTAELVRLNYTLWFALPGITAVLGLLVYWARRR